MQACKSKSAIDNELLVSREDQIIRDYLAEKKINATKLPSGMYYQNLTQGTGEKPVLGDTVRVHYTGNIIYSYVFDSSKFRDAPFQLIVGASGAGSVISGWTIALLDMRVGERGVFYIPSYLAYGSAGFRDRITQLLTVPPNSILVFDMELVQIRKRL